MSYRTYINDVQIFGNNEWYPEWIDFLKDQGIEVDEEGCYEDEITDVMGVFVTVDKIVRRLQKERHEWVLQQSPKEVEYFKKQNKEFFINRELTDLTGSMWLHEGTPWLEFNMQMIKNGYCFLPYQVFKAIEDKIEPDTTRTDCKIDGVDWWNRCYKLRLGETISVSAC